MRFRYFLFIPILMLSCSAPSSSNGDTTSAITDADAAMVREIKTELWGKANGEQDTV